jgi:predicted alpha/beta-hydrolase family hydrolase
MPMSAALTQPRAATVPVDEARQVSGLLQAPSGAGACYVMAHGAGAGMAHPFMAEVANGLAERRIATLRYQFPYMERGSKRPDAPKPRSARPSSKHPDCFRGCRCLQGASRMAAA